jgi:hypothetical protein
MHQTFYIDIDEEITSIVEKLRKAEAPEAVIVVPKRALLIQSIVNLKLLRKVADDLGLKISIVTQDKLGKLLIKKAGISLQQKLEDTGEELAAVDDEDSYQPKKEFKKEIDPTELVESSSRRKRDLEKIGSDDYFASGVESVNLSSHSASLAGSSIHEEMPIADEQTPLVGWEGLEELKEKETIPEVGINRGRKISVSGSAMPSEESNVRRKGSFSMDMAAPARNATQSVAGGPARNATPARPVAVPSATSRVNDTINNHTAKPKTNLNFSVPDEDLAEIPYSQSLKNYTQNSERKYERKLKEMPKDDQLEKFFYASNFSDKGRENYALKKQTIDGPARNATNSVAGGGFFKIVAILGAIVLTGGLFYGAYLYVPKATITIFAKKEVKAADMTITGEVNYDNIDYDKSIVPVKLLEFDEEVAKTFDATGSKSVSNQKAKGKITIYNEFSASAQPLVATTRFLSEDQKIFRLVQGVSVPGTTKVGSEIKPGVVEADVVADESGDAYNIGATSFTIPGFKSSGNDKYAKIYAKSSASMTGGGNGNDTVKVVSDKDISDAKDKISLEITDEVKQKIKASALPGTIILDDAIVIDEPMYRVSNSAGETADSFEIKAQAHARALVFSEGDVKKIANSVIAKSGNGKINIDSGAILIDYGKANADFKLSTIEISVHASNVMQPNINLENIKKDILGKNNDELAEYLKTYQNIEKVEVEYFPQVFVSKVPWNKKRVEVNLDAMMPE